MRRSVSPHIQVKAAGGVRTLDALLEVMALGVTRVGATATKTIIDDFRARKAGRRATRRAGRRPARRAATDARERSASGCSARGSSASSTRSGCATCRGARVVANAAPAASAARPSSPLRRRAHLDSIDALCADPDVDLVVVSLPEPSPPRGCPRRGRPRQGRRCARSRSAGRRRGRRDARGLSATPACSTATSRTKSSRPGDEDARDGRVGRAGRCSRCALAKATRDRTPPTSGMPRPPAAAPSWTWAATASRRPA